MYRFEYRLFFDNNSVSKEKLDLIEEITVDQEIDVSWEAKLNIPFKVDNQGKWIEENEKFIKSFSRVRIELRNIDKKFIPLIDGPVTGAEIEMSSEPGQSKLLITVSDDSVLLNREEKINKIENKSDSEIAEQLFKDAGLDISKDNDKTSLTSNGLTPVELQHNTAMQLLKKLAKRHEFHAFVLPGKNPGKSIGIFKSLPAQSESYQPLILLGISRNIISFNITVDYQKPANFSASKVNITDKKILSAKSVFSDIDLLGDKSIIGKDIDSSSRFVLPGFGESTDLNTISQAKALNSSYSITVNGKIIQDTYPDILQPYKIIIVQLSNSKYSGNYLIKKVTHTLNRSNYSQSFTLIRNAVSAKN